MVTNISFHNLNTTMSPNQADDHSPGQILEAYTVVLSVTCHLLSLFFGGGSSMAVMVAIMTRSNISKYSYLLVVTFLIACCCFNFVYTPMEVVDLLVYHADYVHPTRHFVATKTVIFIFLLALINMVIVALTAEGLLRTSNCYGRLFQRIWPMIASIMTLLVSFILAGIFMGPTAEHPGPNKGFYVLTHRGVRITFLTLLVFLMCTAALACFILIIQMLKTNVYWEDGRLHLRQKKLKLALPEFLISQSNNACEEVESGFENDQDQSRTPSPSTPKLLTVCEQVKGEDATPIADLPHTPPRPSGNRLGINMSQVLGRRRHTICQISDSSSPSAAPVDPIAKAKQYNYVRKFSVDISALQAQLQNPKIFKEAPYQSDIDLAKKSDGAKAPAPKPLLPLKPLKSQLDEIQDRPSSLPEKPENPTPGALPIPPPPVIMVSNEDVVPEHEEGEHNVNSINVDGINGKTEAFPPPVVTVQKPASLPLKDTCTDDLTSAPTLESAITDPSEVESEGQKIVRLALCMALTFIITILPVMVTEILRNRLSEHAFVNISSCTLAVSTIQTIVYPNLLICIDDVVHKAVQKLKARAKNLFKCSSKLDNQHTHVEDTSSTSQV